LFITFEGGEGAGKTTLIDKLESTFTAMGLPVVRTREPGGSALSEHIRSWLLNKEFGVSVGHDAELLLFLAARAQHLEEVIIPALSQGKTVLCDRFNDSTIVYQGIARGIGYEKTKRLCELVCGKTLPDLTLYLDLDPAIGLLRTRAVHKENASEGEVDRIESEALDFHIKVREGFRRLAAAYPERIKTVDASLSCDTVFALALAALKDKFPNFIS